MGCRDTFAALLGPHGIAGDDVAPTYAVDGMVPDCVVSPATVDEVRACAAAAATSGLALIPTGNGTRLGLGRPPLRYDAALTTRRLARVVAHEAADMTVTVEAGATLAEVGAALGVAGQRLPLDPAQPARTTVGGLIASDCCGPLRLAHGKVRDHLIGIRVVLADGRLIKAGGRVVKNVAGYDLMKLFAGSCGTLGIIVEATFKVRPRPEQKAVVVIPAGGFGNAIACAHRVLEGPLAPAFVEAVNAAAARQIVAGDAGAAVIVGLEGIATEVAAQQAQLRRLVDAHGITVLEGADAERVYAGVRDFPVTHAAEGVPACGLAISMLPSRLADPVVRVDVEAGRRGLDPACIVHAGNGVAVMRFGGPAGGSGLPVMAAWVRTLVRAAGGWVVFDALPSDLKAEIDPWGDEAPGLALMRGVKQALDPTGCLSPGRFVGGI
jgi:glycolate oxidase FAD binding subunit